MAMLNKQRVSRNTCHDISLDFFTMSDPRYFLGLPSAAPQEWVKTSSGMEIPPHSVCLPSGYVKIAIENHHL